MRIPDYSKVKVVGPTLGGSTHFHGKEGVVIPAYATTYMVQFSETIEDQPSRSRIRSKSEQPTKVVKTVQQYHHKSLQVVPPRPGEVVLIPAIFQGIGQAETYLVTTPDGKEVAVHKNTVVVVEKQ